MFELERAAAEPEPVVPSLSLEERARQLFKDLPPAEPDTEEEAAAPTPAPLFRPSVSADARRHHRQCGAAGTSAVHSAARAAPGAVTAVQ